MFLAVDVGNSQTTLGLFDTSDEVAAVWRCQSDPKETADELALRLVGYLELGGFHRRQVARAGLASVVPALQRAWRRALERLGIEVVAIDALMPSPVEVAIPYPETLGADRLANAAAARAAYGCPVVVVDFGTATNIDIVDGRGRFVGGVISPGVLLSAEAIFAHAAKLANVAVEMPASVVGSTSETALQSGLVIGAAAQAEGLTERIRESLGLGDCPVVATGGLARTVARAAHCFSTVDPNLTLRGIRILAEGASPSASPSA